MVPAGAVGWGWLRWVGDLLGTFVRRLRDVARKVLGSRAVTQESIVNTRLLQWLGACDAWGFEIVPPFTEESLRGLAPGEVAFRAERTAVIDGETVRVTLTVAETWRDGDDPHGDRRLEQEGCHLIACGWHVQVGETSGAFGAERLDVGDEDEAHPRIHRHPYGAANHVREPAELPPPDGWLHHVNDALGGLLDDGLQDWEELADEEE